MIALYLIFSHCNTKQIFRLASALRRLSPQCVIAIHHDPSGEPLNADTFTSIPNIHIIPNAIKGEWGDISLVKQYLHALTWSLENIRFDWVVTLTGLTYPVAPLAQFEELLEKSGFDAHIYHFDADDPAHWPHGTAHDRYGFRYFKLPRFRYYHRIPLKVREFYENAILKINRSQGIIRIFRMPRGAPTRIGFRRIRNEIAPGVRLQGGRQMLNANRTTIEKIINSVQTNPNWLNFFSRSIIPDEAFFTTLAANDRSLKVNNNVHRYQHWNAHHGANGAVIPLELLREAIDSSAPFALKFDERVSPKVLDQVDEYLGLSITSPKPNPFNRSEGSSRS